MPTLLDKIREYSGNALDSVKTHAETAGEGAKRIVSDLTPNALKDFFGSEEFQSSAKQTAKDLWLPALITALVTGAVGGSLTASSPKRKGETRSQRARRILRNSLVSSLLGTGTIAGLGLAGAAGRTQFTADQNLTPGQKALVDATRHNIGGIAGGTAAAFGVSKGQGKRFNSAVDKISELAQSGVNTRRENLTNNTLNEIFNNRKSRQELFKDLVAANMEGQRLQPSSPGIGRFSDLLTGNDVNQRMYNLMADAGAGKFWTPVEGSGLKNNLLRGKYYLHRLLRKPTGVGPLGRVFRSPAGMLATTAGGFYAGSKGQDIVEALSGISPINQDRKRILGLNVPDSVSDFFSSRFGDNSPSVPMTEELAIDPTVQDNIRRHAEGRPLIPITIRGPYGPKSNMNIPVIP